MMDLVQQRIEELNRHHTVSRFLRQYHALIAARLADQWPQSQELLEVFAAHLEAEIAYHRRLGTQQGLGGLALTVREMVALADWHRAALETCLVRVDSQVGDADAPDVALTAALLKVECNWGLGAHREAAEVLESALAAGDVDAPVVHFALGLNRYLAAEQECVVADLEAGQEAVTDLMRYRARLLEAVSAFEDALAGGALDTDAHRWITVCLERAGFGRAALAAYDYGPGEDGADGDGAPEQDAGSAPITLDEIRHVAQSLRRPQSLLDWRQSE